ncbi:Phophatidylserine decarboxylase-domain-containing protein [Nemania sp. FL0916]|nr:Phophatidylserine decarboxylase-domain-containing protein [Nemania sp. FL0916]
MVLIPWDQAMARSQGSRHRFLNDRCVANAWLASKISRASSDKACVLHASVLEFQNLVEGDAYLQKLARNMFLEIPPQYTHNPAGEPQIRDFTTLLRVFNTILHEGPQFYTSDDETAMGLVGFPITAVLEWPMGTRSGYFFFLVPAVNEALRRVLNSWGSFLCSEASLSALNTENGWLSEPALKLLADEANNVVGGRQRTSDYLSFEELFVCDPGKPYYGFRSWDDFFTRQFRLGVRPVASPDHQPTRETPDPTSVVVNACESRPLRKIKDRQSPWTTGVEWEDAFWLKGQPYSLAHMLNYAPAAHEFIGGGVYQAFLNAFSYHCWHAPVSGRVVDRFVVPGTYFSENFHRGFANQNLDPDPLAANGSQPFISSVATRGVVFIEADNKDIGLMAIVFVGMQEVSSCEFTVGKGDKVVKGQRIGSFHFGGSSYCLVFRPQTKLDFVTPLDLEENLAVNSALAVASAAPS